MLLFCSISENVFFVNQTRTLMINIIYVFMYAYPWMFYVESRRKSTAGQNFRISSMTRITRKELKGGRSPLTMASTTQATHIRVLAASTGFCYNITLHPSELTWVLSMKWLPFSRREIAVPRDSFQSKSRRKRSTWKSGMTWDNDKLLECMTQSLAWSSVLLSKAFCHGNQFCGIQIVYVL